MNPMNAMKSTKTMNMTNSPSLKSARTPAALLALTMLAGSSLAFTQGTYEPDIYPSPPAPPAPTGSFDDRLGLASTLPATPAAFWNAPDTQTIRIVENTDGDEYVVVVEGGQIHAKHNGETFPEHRVQSTGDSIILLSPDGDTLKEFRINVDQSAGAWLQLDGQARTLLPTRTRTARNVWRYDEREPLVARVTGVEARPRVMLGISMAEPDEALLTHLDLKDGILITATTDGLPAARAGLEPKDIVVAIDGRYPATQPMLREVLMTKKPGDSVALKIIRKGEARTHDIKLAEYSATALGLNAQVVVEQQQQQQIDRARAALTEARARLESERARLGEEHMVAIQQSLQAAEEAMRLREHLASQEAEREVEAKIGFHWDPDHENKFMVFSPPTPPTPSALNDDWMEVVDERFEDLEDDLESIEDRLESIADMLEKLLER